MPKFNWRNGFAVGLTLGICLTVFALTAISSGEAPSDFGQSNDSANYGQQQTPQDDHWWLIPRIVYADDTAAQWVMTLATIFAAYLLLRTLWATQEMAADTRRIGEAQIRAYISVESVQVTEKPGIGQGRPLVAVVTVKNYGQSPAYGLCGFVKCVSVPRFDGKLRSRTSPERLRSSLPLGPSARIDFAASLSVPNEVTSIKDEQIIVFGSFTYRDHTGKRRLLRFRYFIDDDYATFRPTIRGNIAT